MTSLPNCPVSERVGDGGRKEGRRAGGGQVLLSDTFVLPSGDAFCDSVGHRTIALLFYLFASGSHVAQTSLEFTV